MKFYLLILALVLITAFYFQPSQTQIEIQTFCSPESRLADYCITLYKPVCGWNNPEKIQCITYPCASTYSNECTACQNPDVLYFTEGECPKP